MSAPSSTIICLARSRLHHYICIASMQIHKHTHMQMISMHCIVVVWRRSGYRDVCSVNWTLRMVLSTSSISLLRFDFLLLALFCIPPRDPFFFLCVFARLYVNTMLHSTNNKAWPILVECRNRNEKKKLLRLFARTVTAQSTYTQYQSNRETVRFLKSSGLKLPKTIE